MLQHSSVFMVVLPVPLKTVLNSKRSLSVCKKHRQTKCIRVVVLDARLAAIAD